MGGVKGDERRGIDSFHPRCPVHTRDDVEAGDQIQRRHRDAVDRHWCPAIERNLDERRLVRHAREPRVVTAPSPPSAGRVSPR